MKDIIKDQKNNPVGSYVSYQRSKRGISLSELSRRSQLSVSYLSKLEGGAYKSPSFEALNALAIALKTPTADFLRKCGLIDEKGVLPSINFHLKEQYYFPPEAIDEVNSYIDYIKSKYKKEIALYKKLHQEYWNKQS
ncbi:helix-turn-helix domain-containing protein [Candidatus Woesebacteria bacterium]|nr:helix-turn-helix domain-containing protein [Candidatus Woesebacteria bacterium]